MYVLSPDLALPEIIIILWRRLFTEQQGVPAVPGPGDYEVLVHVHGPHVVLVAPQGQHQLQTVPGTTSYSPYDKISPPPPRGGDYLLDVKRGTRKTEKRYEIQRKKKEKWRR